MPTDTLDDDGRDDESLRLLAFGQLCDTLDDTQFPTAYIEQLADGIDLLQHAGTLTLMLACDDPLVPVRRFVWGNASRVAEGADDGYSDDERQLIEYLRNVFPESGILKYAVDYIRATIARRGSIEGVPMIEDLLLSPDMSDDAKLQLLRLLFDRPSSTEELSGENPGPQQE